MHTGLETRKSSKQTIIYTKHATRALVCISRVNIFWALKSTYSLKSRSKSITSSEMAWFKKSGHKHANPDHSLLTQMSEITDYLYLGSVMPAKNENMLKERRITNVINATVEEDHEYTIPVDCMKLKITDSLESDIGLYFDIVADKIEKVKNQRGKVLVHCMAGISRSSTLVISYLMKYQKMSLRDAYQFVKKRRPIIRPNPRFWQSLIDYEKKMFGKTTVTMKESDVGLVPELHQKSLKDLFHW